MAFPAVAPDPVSAMRHYIIHIDQGGGAEPLTLMVTVATDDRVLELARDWLGRSPDHRAARIWRDGQPLYEIPSDD